MKKRSNRTIALMLALLLCMPILLGMTVYEPSEEPTGTTTGTETGQSSETGGQAPLETTMDDEDITSETLGEKPADSKGESTSGDFGPENSGPDEPRLKAPAAWDGSGVFDMNNLPPVDMQHISSDKSFDWSASAQALTLSGPGPYTLEGTATDVRVIVDTTANVTIYLDGADLTGPAVGSQDTASAITIEAGSGDVTITGRGKLTGGSSTTAGGRGIHAYGYSGAITLDGIIELTGGRGGAGGHGLQSGGNLIVTGHVTATGGRTSSGSIACGLSGAGNTTITLSGTLEADGGYDGYAVNGYTVRFTDPAAALTVQNGSFIRSLNLTNDVANTIWDVDAAALISGAATDAAITVRVPISPDALTVGLAPLSTLSGMGTVGDPYRIYTVADLITFRDMVNGENGQTAKDFNGEYVRLEENLDISHIADWTAIGYFPTVFAGTFDGNKHTIHGLRVETYNNQSAGLFGRLDGTVQNLALTDIDIDIDIQQQIGAQMFSGGIAGYVNPSAVVQDCSVTGNITVSGPNGNYFHAGGIAGDVRGTVHNCYTVCSISVHNTHSSAGVSFVSGIAGSIASSGRVEGCVALGGSLTAKHDNSIAFAYRIGSNNGTLLGNYGLNTMTLMVNGASRTADDNVDGQDGASITMNEALSASFWRETVGFDDTVWILADGILPLFQPVYGVEVADVALDDISAGDPQPAAKAISITNTGNVDATIANVAVSGSNFSVTNGDSTIAPGVTDESWKIQPVNGLTAGTYSGTITVTYDGGRTATAAVSLTVRQSAAINYVFPDPAVFDRNPSGTGYRDLSVGLQQSGLTLNRITVDGRPLTPDTDYEKMANAGYAPDGTPLDGYTIFASYLETLTVGEHSIVFEMSAGANPTLTLTVVDTTPTNISPTSASFDRNSLAAEHQDIIVTLNPGGYTLQRIEHEGQPLGLNDDYTVSGNQYTIKKEYLEGLEAGAQTLVFVMDGGTDPVLLITVSDTTPIIDPGLEPNEPGYAFRNGNIYTKGSGKSIVLVIDADMDELGCVLVDGNALMRDEHYTAESGSIILTLPASYLETLSVGSHTLAVTFGSYDSIEAAFIVKEADPAPTPTGTTGGTYTTTNTPKTGDDTGLLLAIVLLLVSMAVLVITGWMRKRKSID